MEYLYNVSGQRVSTWNGSTRTAVSGKYYWDSTPVGFYTVGGSTYFEHQNWVGTERAVTSYNGGVIATIASLPFGDGRTVSGTDPDAYDFAGLDYDAESNLDHASYRQLATAQGRWLSPDPYAGSYDFSNPQTLDRYSYALNNPVSLIDPSGLDCQGTEGGYEGDCQDNGDDGSSGGATASGDPDCPGCPPAGLPGSQENPFLLPGNQARAFLNPFGFYYGPDPSFSGPGWQFIGAIPMGAVYSPPAIIGGGGSAPSNLLQRGVNAFNKFNNACGNKYSTALAVSDGVGLFGISSYAVSGIASLSSTLTNNAIQTASQVGASTGTSAAEVLATGGAAGEVSATTIAQGASLAGNVLGTVAKFAGAVTAAATVSSVGIRAGCALGIF